MALASAAPLFLGTRRIHDAGFAAGFLLSFAIVIVTGVIAFINNNVQGIHASPCGGGSSTAMEGGNADFQATMKSFMLDSWIFGLVIPLSVAVGIAWVLMLKTCAKQIVYTTLVVTVVGWLMAAAVLYSFGSRASIVFLILGLIWAALVACLLSRGRLQLSVELLQQSAKVLSDHHGLVYASLGLLVGKVIFLLFCLSVIVALLTNGEFTSAPIHDSSDFSLDDSRGMHQSTTACRYVFYSGAEAGIAFTLFFTYWMLELLFVIRFHVVSFTTGAWYFKSSIDSSDAPSKSGSPITTALRLGFSASFGSLCCASLLLTICEFLKKLARSGQRQNNMLLLLISCCIQCILSYIEFLTKFAVAYHSLTGDAFCVCAKRLTDTMNTHGFVSMVAVDWISKLVLAKGALIFSLLIALLASAATKAQLAHVGQDADIMAGAPLYIGLVSLVLSFAILHFLGSILLNVVDASFTCLIFDLDNRQQHQPGLAAAVVTIVKPDYIVHQPGGAAPVIATPVYANAVAPGQAAPARVYEKA